MSLIRKTFAFAGVSLLVLLAIVLLLAAAVYAGLGDLIGHGTPAVLHIDGDTFTFGELSFGHALVAAAALVLAGIIVAVVVPMALAFAALAIVVALVAGLGAPMIALGLLALLLASPVLLIAGLLWLIVRPRKAATAPGAHTIHA